MPPTVLLIRPADHLILAVSWTGLRVDGTSAGDEVPVLVAGDGGAALLVTFPPQHLAEETLAESEQSQKINTSFVERWFGTQRQFNGRKKRQAYRPAPRKRRPTPLLMDGGS